MANPRKNIRCRRCSKIKPHYARKLCKQCYQYSHDHNELDKYPGTLTARLCEKCKKMKTRFIGGVCMSCYTGERQLVRGFGSQVMRIYLPEGNKEEIAKLYEETKNKVFEDAIKNPGKYLRGVPGEKEKKDDKKNMP